MKSIIETELPSSTGKKKVELLELQHCDIDTYITGLELEKKILKTYSRLMKLEEPFICSLSELVQSIHYIDLALYYTHQASIISLNYFFHEELFYKNYSKYREDMYEALKNDNYTDSLLISNNELSALATHNEYVLENSFVDCDFSFSAFEKAFKFNKQLIKYGVRDKTTSTTDYLYDLREDLYYSECLRGLDTKAGKKFIKSMEQKQL